MLYYGVIFLSALSLVLGHLSSSPSPFRQHFDDDLDLFNTPSPQPTSSTLEDAEETEVDEVMGICFFGSYPTATCMVKCFWKNKSAYCDEDANCRCGNENEEEDVERSYRAPQEDFTTLQPDFDDEEGMMGVCYFGHIPSPSCMFRCSVRGQAPACDEDSRCLCEDHTWRQFLTPTHSFSDGGSDKELIKNETESDDDDSVVFFIFDLGGLFESEDVPKKEDPADCTSPKELWTVPHIVALAILTLVAVLLVLELSLCCKRRYHKPCKQHLQTVLSSEVLEKGIMNGKLQ